MDIGTFRGITTLLVLFCFLGVVAWAYSRRRKDDFDEASRLPFADEEEASEPPRDASPGEPRSGNADAEPHRGDNKS